MNYDRKIIPCKALGQNIVDAVDLTAIYHRCINTNKALTLRAVDEASVKALLGLSLLLLRKHCPSTVFVEVALLSLTRSGTSIVDDAMLWSLRCRRRSLQLSTEHR